MTRQRGAALMIMLMIAGVVGAMFTIQLSGRGASERAQVAATTLALSQAREALIGFALVNGRLPRPAIPGTNGVENPAVCVSDAACSGTLPWVTLGVSQLDSWGKALRYSVSKEFSQIGLALTTVPTRKVQTRNAVGVLGFVNGKGSVAACAVNGAGATDVTSDCTPAILFSTGKMNFGSTDEMTNSTASTMTFVRRAATENTAAPGGAFDDIVIWLSGNVLFDRMQKAGKL